MTKPWCLAVALLLSSAVVALAEKPPNKGGANCMVRDWEAPKCTNHKKITCHYHRDEHCKVNWYCTAPWSGSPAC